MRQTAMATEMTDSTLQGCSLPGSFTPSTYWYVPKAPSLHSSLFPPNNTAGPSRLRQTTDGAAGAGGRAGKPTGHHMPPWGMALTGSGRIMDGA